MVSKALLSVRVYADLIHLLGEVGDARLAQMVGRLANQAVVEIRASEGASHKGRCLAIRRVDLD